MPSSREVKTIASILTFAMFFIFICILCTRLFVPSS